MNRKILSSGRALCLLATLWVSSLAAPWTARADAARQEARPLTMICVVEGMGSRINEGTLCSKLERLIGVTMVTRDDPWARDSEGTLRVIGGDVDVLVAVAWRGRRIAWARRSWMELGSQYVSILGLTVHELLPLSVVQRAEKLKAKSEAYRPASILRSEIIDPWELSRMPRGAGLLPWERPGTARTKRAKK